MPSLSYTTKKVLVALVCVGTLCTYGFLADEKLPQKEAMINVLPKVGESVTTEGYTITNEGPAPAPKPAVPLPAFRVVPERPPSLDAEAYAKVVGELKKRIATIEKEVAANTARAAATIDPAPWLDVAMYRNTLGDAPGARSIWKYLTVVTPALVQPYGNLGSSYMASGDFKEARMWYGTAIEHDHTVVQYYQDMATMYLAEKKTSQAVAVLTAGIVANTHDWSLLVSLGRIYNSSGSLQQAHAAFNDAIARATKAGDMSAAAAIEREKIYTQ